MTSWDSLASGEPAREARAQRPRELGACEPLLLAYGPDTRDRYLGWDGGQRFEADRGLLERVRPVRAWVYGCRRWIEHDAAYLELDFAYEADGDLALHRGQCSADHRYPPPPHEESGQAFTLLLDPHGPPIPLAFLRLHCRVTYGELYALAVSAEDEATRATAVAQLLEILHRVRNEAPAQIRSAFADNHRDFSQRGHDPFYVVADLFALVRQGKDPLPFLIGTDRFFAAQEQLVAVAGPHGAPFASILV